MSELKVIAREAYYIKASSIKKRDIAHFEKKHTYLFFEEKACQACEFLEDRQASESGIGDACGNCAAFKGGAKLAKTVKIGDNKYLSIPSGDKKGIKEYFKNRDLVFKSKRPDVGMKRKIKFTGKLRDYQRDAVDTIKKKKYGIVKAPPRSGKTVLSTAASCEIGQKTMIVAAQREWLDGFYETFCGSPTQKPLTNAKKSQVGFCKTLKDFEKYDVCLVTVQTFHSERGQKLLRKVRDKFGVIIVDEVHMGAAEKFLIAVAALNSRYKIGLSGTPSRKDGKFILVDALLGGVIFQAKVEQLRPKVQLVRTEYAGKGGGQWASIVKSLETNPKRLKLIAQWAIKDAKAGHMVLIPLSQVVPIKALTKAINKMAGKKMAHAFWGGLQKDKRKQLIQDARTYKARILVGNSKLVSVGTNIPRASAIYYCHLSANLENSEQRIARVLTPYDDKPQPLLRIFLDNSNISRNCLRKEWFGAIRPKFKPIISEVDKKILHGYFSEKEKKNDLASWQL